MKKAVVNVMLITIIAKLLGFAREIILSYCFGASGISDAYLISLTIPGTIFQFVGTGLATCFIPVYLKIITKKGSKEGNTFVNTVLSLVLIFSTIVVVGIWIWGDVVVKIFASGFTGKTFEYAVLFTKISVSSLYMSTFVYVFNSLLQANDYFSATAFAAIPNSLMVIISIVLGAKMNLILLPVGSVVAILIQALFLIPYAKKCHFKLRLNFDFQGQYMKEMYRLIIPVIVGVSVNEINVLVDKTIASNVAEGGISALSYAYSLIMFVQGIFAQTIATVYYPSITKMAEEKGHEKLQKTIDEAISGMLFLLLPIMAGCILLASVVVEVLYGRGAFDTTAVSMTATALIGYAIGIIGYGMREVLSRVFYALNDTKTPTRNAMLGMVLNILMNIVFSRFVGIGGLALATSVSSIITSLLLLRDLKKRDIYSIDKNLMRTVLKMIVSALGMSALICVIHVVMTEYSQIIYLASAIIVGGVGYFLFAYLLKTECLLDSIKQLKSKKDKRRI